MDRYKTKYRFEVGARSVADYLAAWRGGADRVELYTSPLDGALTPSAGLVRETVKARRLHGAATDIFVMIRPRPGDPCYQEHEYRVMLADIAAAAEAGADGIMTCILRPDGTTDTERMREIRETFPQLRMTMHRGFECAKDPEETLEQAVGLGIELILVGGMRSDTEDNLPYLRNLHRRADGRIRIMTALGDAFRNENLPRFIGDGLPEDFHAVNNFSRGTRAVLEKNFESTSSDDHLNQTMDAAEYLDGEKVRAFRRILSQFEPKKDS